MGHTDCSACPKVLEANRLFPSAAARRSCAECPEAFVSSRFRAVVARAEAGRLPVRSCTRILETAGA